MTYVRPSSLGVAEFCPRATELSEQSGISRAAVMSTAWHAKLAGNDTLIGELHPDERKEVAAYGTPTDTQCDGIPLLWADAIKECHVQLWERDTLLTEGTLDAAWVVTLNDNRRWAFIGDNKRSTWAIPDGPDCLQLAAYGHAYAVLNQCMGYTPGLWSGTDSSWTWGTPVDLTTPEALDLWQRLKRAARNDHRLIPESKPDMRRFVTGAHCGACYGRMRCPEWSCLALSTEALLNSTQTNCEITSENAAGLLTRAKAMAELSELLQGNIKTFAERGGVVKDPATGKVFLPTATRGREALDKEALLRDYPEATKYWRRGKPGQTFGWRRP